MPESSEQQRMINEWHKIFEDEKITNIPLELGEPEEQTNEAKLSSQINAVHKNEVFDQNDAFCLAKLRSSV